MNIFERWKNLSDAAKSSLAFALSALLIKGLSFISTPIYTRIIDTEQYGLVGTYNSWLAVIEIFALLGMTSAGVFNVGLNDHKNNRASYISNMIVLCNFMTIIVFLIIFAVKNLFYPSIILPNGLLISMLISFIFSPALIFWITWQRYEYKYKVPFVFSISSSFLTQLITVIVILNVDKYPLGEVKIWITTIVGLIFNVPIYLFLLYKGRSFFNKNIWKTSLMFAIPLLPHYIAQHIMSAADRIMINDFSSSTGVAIYSVVANISMVSTIVWSAINASLVPYTFEKIEGDGTKQVNGVVVPIVIFYAVICFVVCLIAPEILWIMGPKEYSVGIYAVPPLTAAAFASALYNIYANIEFYNKKTSWIAISTIVATIVNVVLNYCLIPKYGFVAASYTTLISYLVLNLMHFLGYKKCPERGIYNDKIILVITGVLVALCLVSNVLYLNAIVRYCFIVLIGAVVIVKRNYILDKYKQMKNG